MSGGRTAVAMFQEPAGAGKVRCGLCAHACVIRPGRRGICKVRENVEGVLLSLSYGMLASIAVDPIEKKPLFHFLPATTSLSIATMGCNLACPWCQNHSLSRIDGRSPVVHGRRTDPAEVVSRAVHAGCASISFTYSEPTVFYEYARDIGMAARGQGLRNVFVTNGHMTRDVARDAAETFLDAANIDLKGATPSFYRHRCKGSIDAVRESIALLHSLGVWIEVTSLVIPGLNDADEDLESLAGFVASVDRSIPWHVSRFHPEHRLGDVDPTPASTLARAMEAGRRAGLAHVYMGNVWGGGGEDTACQSCGKILIRRFGFATEICGLDGSGRCEGCGHRLGGVFA